MRRPLLLLPRPVDQFINGEQAAELLRAGHGAVALPGRLPYSALTRSPAAVRGGVARSIAWHCACSLAMAFSAVAISERMNRSCARALFDGLAPAYAGFAPLSFGWFRPSTKSM